MSAKDDELTAAFYRAAMFLLDRIETDGWRWSSNYLREHVRCTTRLKFSNTRSPGILRQLRKAHPRIAKYVKIGTRK